MISSTAGHVPQFLRDSRRLWSLWDMKDFRASELIGLSKEIGRLVYLFETTFKDQNLSEESKGSYIETLSGHVTSFEDLGLMMCKLHAERIVRDIKGGDVSSAYLTSSLTELFNRISDECDLRHFISLTQKEADLFAGSKPIFGQDFGTKFPTEGTFEVDEAAKCLALGRPTAAVFHLMRSMEIGIRALATCLGIPDPVKPAERNWAIILKSILDAIAVKWPKASDRMKGDGKLFEELYASLDAVKNPWRNSTMHVESKFTDDEAEHILIAVKGFMKKLASRMDEKGEPNA